LIDFTEADVILLPIGHICFDDNDFFGQSRVSFGVRGEAVSNDIPHLRIEIASHGLVQVIGVKSTHLLVYRTAVSHDDVLGLFATTDAHQHRLLGDR